MANDDRSRAESNWGKVPVTPAPTRSQTNLASRAAGSELRSVEEGRRGIPLSAAKPPPGVSPAKQGRRIGDAGLAAVELREPGASQRPTASADTEVPEGASDAARPPNFLKIAAECLLVLICIMTGIVTPNRVGEAIVAPSHPAAAPPATREIKLPDDAGAAFRTAIDDLDGAVADIPEQSPEQILRTVSGPGHDCLLLWNGDYPSVIFGRAPVRPNSLAANLEGCAQAIKQLPR